MMNKTNTAIEATEVMTRSETTTVDTQKKSWKDYVVLSKQGIVTSNSITTFAGVYLAMVYTTTTGLSAHIDTMIFALLGAALVMGGACTLNNYIDRDIDQV